VNPDIEGLVSYAYGTASDEVADLLDQFCRQDMTAGVMIALAVILRSAFDRKQAFEQPQADLKLVPSCKRKRP
jgi:hypothetical protein